MRYGYIAWRWHPLGVFDEISPLLRVCLVNLDSATIAEINMKCGGSYGRLTGYCLLTILLCSVSMWICVVLRIYDPVSAWIRSVQSSFGLELAWSYKSPSD